MFHRPIVCHGRIWPVEKQYVLMVFVLCFCQLVSTITATVQHAGLEHLRRKPWHSNTESKAATISLPQATQSSPKTFAFDSTVPQKVPKSLNGSAMPYDEAVLPTLAGGTSAEGKTSRSRLINSSLSAASREFIQGHLSAARPHESGLETVASKDRRACWPDG